MRSGFWTRASSLGGRGAAKKQVRLQSQGPALAPPPATAGGGWEGVPRFEASPKAPLPNPSGPPAQLACVRRRASQWRSEEHTSELQSLMRISYAVFCLKKKKNEITQSTRHHITSN